MGTRELTDKIILHCSYTKPDMNWGAAEIRKIHVEERGFDDIGYHYIIKRNGVVDPGRTCDAVGAHCFGHNQRSIGICLIGGMAPDGSPVFNFTGNQLTSLNVKLMELRHEYPSATVHGHNEFSNKACPCFDVRSYIGD